MLQLVQENNVSFIVWMHVNDANKNCDVKERITEKRMMIIQNEESKLSSIDSNYQLGPQTAATWSFGGKRFVLSLPSLVVAAIVAAGNQ